MMCVLGKNLAIELRGNNKMKKVAIIEARMSSSRLPGKVLLKVLGKPMLWHLVQRVKRVQQIDEIVLATTVNLADDVLEEFAHQVGISCYRGSEEDVMQRVLLAGQMASADVVVEITGDCPLIDPEIIDHVIETFKSNSVDYVSNAYVRSYPDGMDVQVFRLDALHKSLKMTNDPLDHEHVTYHILRNPDVFSQIHLVAPLSLRWPELGLTLDEQADFELIENILMHLSSSLGSFKCIDIIHYLKDNDHLLDINCNVKRKGYA